jgi:hypothetical protein
MIVSAFLPWRCQEKFLKIFYNFKCFHGQLTLSASCGLNGHALDLYQRSVWRPAFHGPERYTGVPRHVVTTVRTRQLPNGHNSILNCL